MIFEIYKPCMDARNVDEWKQVAIMTASQHIIKVVSASSSFCWRKVKFPAQHSYASRD